MTQRKAEAHFMCEHKGMRKEEALVLGREDMIEAEIGKPIHLIDFTDFRISHTHFQQSIVLFIDDNGQTKILKNRYGEVAELVDAK